MIEEKTIYHDDDGFDVVIQLDIVTDFVQVTVNHEEKGIVVRFDRDTAWAFAKEILRKCEEIERNIECMFSKQISHKLDEIKKNQE